MHPFGSLILECYPRVTPRTLLSTQKTRWWLQCKEREQCQKGGKRKGGSSGLTPESSGNPNPLFTARRSFSSPYSTDTHTRTTQHNTTHMRVSVARKRVQGTLLLLLLVGYRDVDQKLLGKKKKKSCAFLAGRVLCVPPPPPFRLGFTPSPRQKFVDLPSVICVWKIHRARLGTPVFPLVDYVSMKVFVVHDVRFTTI